MNEVGLYSLGKELNVTASWLQFNFKVYPPPHLAEQIFCESEIRCLSLSRTPQKRHQVLFLVVLTLVFYFF